MAYENKLILLGVGLRVKPVKKITHEQIRCAMDHFFAQGGTVEVLKPQKHRSKSLIHSFSANRLF